MIWRRAMAAACTFIAGCAAPATHPAGGPYCFVMFASYGTAPQFKGIARSEAESMERDGRPFLVAFFDDDGKRKALFECHKGVCGGKPRGSRADERFSPADCPRTPVQAAVDAR